jgi:SAM-dependent methyltransferase
MSLEKQLKIWRPFINNNLYKAANLLDIKFGNALEIGPTKGNADQDPRYNNNPIYTFFSNFKIKTGCIGTNWADYKLDISNEMSISDDLKNKFDIVFLIEVAEHVKKPWNIVHGVDKILKSNGYVIISTPCFVDEHPSSEYGDYWRFLPNSHDILFEGYNLFFKEVCYFDISFPYGVFSVFQKNNK